MKILQLLHTWGRVVKIFREYVKHAWVGCDVGGERWACHARCGRGVPQARSGRGVSQVRSGRGVPQVRSGRGVSQERSGGVV